MKREGPEVTCCESAHSLEQSSEHSIPRFRFRRARALPSRVANTVWTRVCAVLDLGFGPAWQVLGVACMYFVWVCVLYGNVRHAVS